MKNWHKVALFLVVVLSFGLRIYQLNIVPPSLDWDEADVGYNAFAIANWGHDEWGKAWPLSFESFGDYKSPVHIYITALIVKLLGLSDFAVRIPAAIFGTLDTLLIYFLAKELFKNAKMGLIASFVLAISPYNLQFSRFNHEAVFALFFFMLGLYLFLKGLRLKNWLLSLGFFSFGITLITYHAPKVVTPIFLIVLIGLYFKSLIKIKWYFLAGLISLGLISSLFFIDPNLTGLARASQASIPDSVYKELSIYHDTHNLTLAKIDYDWARYFTSFSLDYLFVHGDKNPRHSTQLVGEFYMLDAFFLILGAIYLLKHRSRASWVILAWALLGPLPVAITGGTDEAPHAARALLTMGSWQLIIACGVYWLIYFFKSRAGQIIVGISVLTCFIYLLTRYLIGYYTIYPQKSVRDWQYGFTLAAEYVQDHPHQYHRVFVTASESQPYVFFLYQLKVPLPEYLENVSLTQGPSWSSNMISTFWYNHTEYNFGNWNIVESSPDSNVLYVLTPSEYDGLRHKPDFKVVDKIKYLDGGDAFFLVTNHG